MQKLSMNLNIKPFETEEIYQKVEEVLIDYIYQSDALSNIDKLEYDIGRLFYPLAKVSLKQNLENPYAVDMKLIFHSVEDLMEFKYNYYKDY